MLRGLAALALLLASWQSARATETSLFVSSEPGDWVGGGGEFSYAADDGTFTARSFDGDVSVLFRTPTLDAFWSLAFGAANAAPLTVGIYREATRWPGLDRSGPRMSVGGTGTGCNEVKGSFQIKEARYGPAGEIEALWVLFQQHCEGASPALRGDLRWNAAVDVALRAPLEKTVEKTSGLQFGVSATDVDGGPLSLHAIGLPEGAAFTDHGDGTGTFAWVPRFDQGGTYDVTFVADDGLGATDASTTRIFVAGITALLLDGRWPGVPPSEGPILFFGPDAGEFTPYRNFDLGASVHFHTPSYDHFWTLDFAAPFSAPLSTGTYTGATRFPFQEPEEPGLSVYGDGRSCNRLTGSFEVKQITWTPSQDVSAFWATFEQQCEGETGVLRGEIRLNAAVPVLLRGPRSVTASEGRETTFELAGHQTAPDPLALSALDLPPGATLADRGDGTASFRWTPTTEQIGFHVVRFEARNALGEADRLPTQIAVRPLNDDLEHALVIAGLPFQDARSTLTAMSSPDDPVCQGSGTPGDGRRSVWYVLRPEEDVRVTASTAGSGYPARLAAFLETPAALVPIVCATPQVSFTAVAGRTYFFMVEGSWQDQAFDLALSVLGKPPLRVGVEVGAHGRVHPRTGAAFVEGTVTCSRPVLVELFGVVRQMASGQEVVGSLSVRVPCDGMARWTASATGNAPGFAGGPGSVSVLAIGDDPVTGEGAGMQADVEIHLHGRPHHRAPRER